MIEINDLFLTLTKTVTLLPFLRLFSLRFGRVPELSPTPQGKDGGYRPAHPHMTQKIHVYTETRSPALQSISSSNTFPRKMQIKTLLHHLPCIRLAIVSQGAIWSHTQKNKNKQKRKEKTF